MTDDRREGDALMSLELYEFQKEDVEKIYPRGNGLIGSEMG
jgi:hypothetical protein